MDAANPPASQIEQTFTAAERTRIRAALVTYAREHRIGVPTLRARISKTTNRTRNVPSGKDPYLVDQKTLQRFLADSHRTNDAFIVPLAQFVASSCPVHDEVDEFALSATRFFGRGRSDDQPHVCGHYVVFDENRPKQMALDDEAKSFRRLSTLEFSSIEGAAFRATEQVLVPEDKTPTNSEEYRLLYEGSIFDLTAPIVVLMRNTLTGYLKSYWFYRSNTEDGYYGFCSIQPFEEPKKVGFFDRTPQQIYMKKR